MSIEADQPDTRKLPESLLYVQQDMVAFMALVRKLQKPLTSANWANERKLILRQIKQLRVSLGAFEKSLRAFEAS